MLLHMMIYISDYHKNNNQKKKSKELIALK